MNINGDLIDHLSHLARLHFDNESKTEIINDLKRILTFVEKLNEINTDGIEPLVYMIDENNKYREDMAMRKYGREDALKNAPRHDSDYFRVPRFMES